MKTNILSTCTIVFLPVLFLNSSCQGEKKEGLPNILWLVSEDNSPFLGCYGDQFATTPNLDKLASEGFLYTKAYANAPVCAPARNTILTGVYANSGGNQHMRSNYPMSAIIKPYPLYLRELGYYCTNNAKTDYNTSSVSPKKIWDESGNHAHYKHRRPGQPFFAVFNCGISHESSIHQSTPNNQLRHDPDKVPVPPYHPATPEMKHDWAQYYDKVEDMDAWIGEKLKELQDAGLAENTIVFYYGDNGGVLARSKRYVYESGTRVPFIVRIPEKYKHLYPAKKTGVRVDWLISFVDLVPTLLSITGIPVPDYLQGHAFLGEQKTKDPEYAFMFRDRMDERYDMCRAVRSEKYRYIRNYMPYRIYGQHLEYLWKAPSMRSWEQAYLNGECNEIQRVFWNSKPAEELYDTENDPWEVNNLAGNPGYKHVLEKMRIANNEWIRKIYDTGFIPEADWVDKTKGQALYDFMRSGKPGFEKIFQTADMATSGEAGNIDQLKSSLNDEDSSVRYWGVTGLLMLGEKAAPATEELKQAVQDPSGAVAIMAAEALYNMGEREIARCTLLKQLKSPDEFVRCNALNTIDCIHEKSPEIIQGVIELMNDAGNGNKDTYDRRAARWLIEKWKVN
jgi:arylsulfatase A-like enzyme